jgi:hypothetical protein
MDSSKTRVFHAAVVHDEHGQIVGRGGYWSEPDGTPITDPARIKEIESTMATKGKGDEFTEGDRVEILDDDGKPTGQAGAVEVYLGASTYLVRLDNGEPLGTMPSHMQKAQD